MKIKITLSSIGIMTVILLFIISAAVVAVIDTRVTNKLEGVFGQSLQKFTLDL